MRLRNVIVTWSIVPFCFAAVGDELPPPEHPLELRDGERVALLGGTFIERMQVHGYLETLLTAAHPDRVNPKSQPS